MNLKFIPESQNKTKNGGRTKKKEEKKNFFYDAIANTCIP